MAEQKVRVDVEGRELTLSNLSKVLYPEVGFTKGDVLHYYASIGAVMLPHLAGRPLTFKRYPDGVDGKFFFEKNAPRSAPGWIKTVRVPSSGSRTVSGQEWVDHPLLADLAGLTWAANLAALELHTPMWRVGKGEPPRPPDLMVFDLDPGPPASVVECCEVALLLQPLLKEEGLDAYAKTSGSKGLQLYVSLTGKKWSWPESTEWAHELAKRAESQNPKQVVSKMTKSLREGKVFIDWSQNSPSKTTIAVYSLRAREHPTVSTPVQWSEVEGCVGSGKPLVFEAGDVVDRVADLGDLFAPLAR